MAALRQHAVPPPARGGPVAPSNAYAARPPFPGFLQCPPAFSGPTWNGTDLPDEAEQPDGTQVTCNCDEGLTGGFCDATDGGVCAEFLQEELTAALAGSGDPKSCDGVISVRPDCSPLTFLTAR